jgi:chaperonin cofactor prefoldin
MKMKKFRKFRLVLAGGFPLFVNQFSYKLGDCFVYLPQPEVLELLAASTETVEKDVSALEDKLEAIREEMQELKVALYARFGKSINLET